MTTTQYIGVDPGITTGWAIITYEEAQFAPIEIQFGTIRDSTPEKIRKELSEILSNSLLPEARVFGGVEQFPRGAGPELHSLFRECQEIVEKACSWIIVPFPGHWKPAGAGRLSLDTLLDVAHLAPTLYQKVLTGRLTAHEDDAIRIACFVNSADFRRKK